MLPSQRQEEIIQTLAKSGAVIVRELAGKYEVTEDCIRKDLAMLEKAGRLRRTYGGAVPVRQNPHLFAAAERETKNIEQKRAIAARAFELIEDGDTVFLDISTASLELARLIFSSGRPITVVSTMLEIIMLASSSSTRFIAVGGHFEPNRNGFAGGIANSTLQKFRFDLAFFGTAGVDLNFGAVYTYTAEDGDTKAAAMAAARRTYLLCERRKFEQDGNYAFADVSEFSGMILEKAPSDELTNIAADLALNLIY